MINDNADKIIPQAESKVPARRFPEFRNSTPWQEKTLCQVLDYERPENYIVSTTNYVAAGIPVLTANKSFILGYTQEDSGIYTKVPVIIFDDFTTDKKFVNFPFKVKSSAIKILKPKNKNNLKFLFELLNTIKFEIGNHKRYYISEYQNLNVQIPESEEQEKIAACLSSIDNLISTKQTELESLKKYKKGLLQQLFPQGNNNLPALRFPEFKNSQPWEKISLQQAAEFINKKRSIIDLSAKKYISTENILQNFAGFYATSTLPSSGAATEFDVDDILVSNIRPYLKKIWVAEFCGGASNDVIVIRARQNINQYFLAYNLKNDIFINFMMSGAKGVKMPRGDIILIKQYIFLAPQQSEEQKKIADCLTSLDSLINLKQQELDKLSHYKKGLLQQLLVQG